MAVAQISVIHNLPQGRCVPLPVLCTLRTPLFFFSWWTVPDVAIKISLALTSQSRSLLIRFSSPVTRSADTVDVELLARSTPFARASTHSFALPQSRSRPRLQIVICSTEVSASVLHLIATTSFSGLKLSAADPDSKAQVVPLFCPSFLHRKPDTVDDSYVLLLWCPL